MANNNIDPQIMAKLIQLYHQGMIPIQNQNINPQFGNNNPTVFIPPNQNQGDNWLIYFQKKPENSIINIQISSSETVSNAYLKYREKSLEYDVPLKFTYKGKPLDGKLSLSASGLSNNAIITVEKMQISNNNNFINPNNNNQITIQFENQSKEIINIQVRTDQLVRDAINAYKNKIKNDKDLSFFFNAKTLNEEMTIQQAGIKNQAKILVIETSHLIGA